MAMLNNQRVYIYIHTILYRIGESNKIATQYAQTSRYPVDSCCATPYPWPKSYEFPLIFGEKSRVFVGHSMFRKKKKKLVLVDSNHNFLGLNPVKSCLINILTGEFHLKPPFFLCPQRFLGAMSPPFWIRRRDTRLSHLLRQVNHGVHIGVAPLQHPSGGAQQ